MNCRHVYSVLGAVEIQLLTSGEKVEASDQNCANSWIAASGKGGVVCGVWCVVFDRWLAFVNIRPQMLIVQYSAVVSTLHTPTSLFSKLKQTALEDL